MWQIERLAVSAWVEMWEPVSESWQGQKDKLTLEVAMRCAQRIHSWRRATSRMRAFTNTPWPGGRPHRLRNTDTQQVIML